MRPSSRTSSTFGDAFSHRIAVGRAHVAKLGVSDQTVPRRYRRLREKAGVRVVALTEPNPSGPGGKILAINRESKGVYYAPRITSELHDGGELIGEKTVARIMRLIGIVGISPRTFKVRTTVVDSFATFADDLVQLRFEQGRIDAVWSSDITYLTCGEADMYLCAVKDEQSKKVLGWSVADHMRAELVIDALEMAIAARGGDVAGTILHSDRGSQYTSEAVKQMCDRHGLRRSMGETGICWDNVGAESLWSTFKHEPSYRHTFDHSTELVVAVDNWMDFYNSRRRHSTIEMLSPHNYEQSLNAPIMAA